MSALGETIDTTAGESGGCTLSACKVDGIANPNIYGACPPAALGADRGNADGNVLCITTKTSCDSTAARSYGWTSFNMAQTVTAGTTTSTLAYTPEHARGSLATSSGTLYYFANPAAGVQSELLAGATPQWRTYLRADGGRIVAEFFTSAGNTVPYYFTGDNLSSTTAITDANGNSVEYDSYDAWGQRRHADGTDYPSGCYQLRPSSVTTRGYTGQEMMDNFCLVNLNARLYDPALGRMLSADPTVPYALSGQSFNRYSYVENGPLSVIDPSGYTDNACPNNCPQQKLICIECLTGNMPDWGDYGPGIETINDFNQAISAEEFGMFAGDNEFTFSIGNQSMSVSADQLLAGIAWGENQAQFASTLNFSFPQIGAELTNSIVPTGNGGSWGSGNDVVVQAGGYGVWTNQSMSVDLYGEEFIKSHEGFSPTIYDSNGTGDWTIGWGHAVRGSAHQIYDHAYLTNNEAEALFQSDINVAEEAVRRNMQFSLSQNQFDALTDFAFNIGANAFANSYTISLLNSYSNFGDLIYAESMWDGAFGNPERRGDEVGLYNGSGF